MPYIPIKCADQRFAPSVDTVTITYGAAPRGQYVSLDVEIYDYANVLVYSRRHACAAGPPALQWDGTINQGGGVNEPFATPLRSPYTARVQAVIADLGPVRPSHLSASEAPPREIAPCRLGERREDAGSVEAPAVIAPVIPDSVQLAVLYHSIEIVRGPWLATGEVFVAASDEDICNRLNALGYYAGPPARVAADVTFFAKAKERFRRNCGALRTVLAPTNQQFVAALVAAAGTPRPTLTDHANAAVAVGAALPQAGAEPMRIYVESIGFQTDYVANTDEFNDQYAAAPSSKTTQDAARLNRPLIPLEAVIYLQDRAGARTPAPLAVGDVRIDWKVTEPAEDTATLPYNDAVACGTRTYIRRLLGRLPDSTLMQTNCLDRYGGIRTAVNNHRNPFWREAHPYAPYAVPAVDDDLRAVHVAASTDPDHAAQAGRAGLYFHPSLIAGDRYQLTAALHFDGRPNAAVLAEVNAGKHYETAPIVVWRRAEVLAVVGWPNANLGNLAQEVRREYAHAYVELDFAATTYPAIGTVLDDGHYTQLIQHTALSRINPRPPAFAIEVDTTHLRTNPIHLLPVRPLTQVIEIYKLAVTIFSEQRFAAGEPRIPHPGAAEFLTGLLASQLRIGHPAGGVLVLQYQHHVDVRKACETMGVVPTTSNGNADLLAIIDQDAPGTPWYIFAHEVGHCFWLRHHQNVRDNLLEKFDHDQFDHNCIMSYTRDPAPAGRAHQTAAGYAPNFCGKCNLKLRGWDILHADIVAQDSTAPVRTLFFHDAADPGLEALGEIETVRNAVTGVARGPFRVRSFNANAVLATWMAALGECDIYHHVSHGSARCQWHGLRAPTLARLTPRYPLCCLDDAARQCELLEAENRKALADDRRSLETWAAEKLIKPDEFWHKLRSVIQWKVDIDDPSRDIEFTYDQIKGAIAAGARTPRLLAFFNASLLGWDNGLARLFIDAGTRFVIAFRSHFEAAHVQAFSSSFYQQWQHLSLAPNAVRPAFIAAAHEQPHAEPVLFAQNEVIRAWATTMEIGSGDLAVMRWDEVAAFAKPRFPDM